MMRPPCKKMLSDKQNRSGDPIKLEPIRVDIVFAVQAWIVGGIPAHLVSEYIETGDGPHPTGDSIEHRWSLHVGVDLSESIIQRTRSTVVQSMQRVLTAGNLKLW